MRKTVILLLVGCKREKWKCFSLLVLGVLILVACQSDSGKQVNQSSENQQRMTASIEKDVFGQLDNGQSVDLYTLKNKQGMEAKVTPFGGTLVSLLVPDRNGRLEDVVLGYDHLKAYETCGQNFGTTVGRYANRINKGRFSLDGKQFQLAINNGPNHLHGGELGFAKKIWKAAPVAVDNGVALQLTYFSEDGEENYPGKLSVEVIYQLSNDNELLIHYTATSDQTTVINLTHHSYFNLNGNGKGDILDHELTIHADQMTATNEELIPTGQLVSVTNTPFDFRQPIAIGARINEANEQLRFGNGYDHNWVVRNWDQQLKSVATLYAPKSGRRMETLTTEPGLQVYTANWLNSEVIGKGGIPARPHQAVCLEAQHFPDSPNHPDFPSVILKPGEKYTQQTVYRFDIKR